MCSKCGCTVIATTVYAINEEYSVFNTICMCGVQEWLIPAGNHHKASKIALKDGFEGKGYIDGH